MSSSPALLRASSSVRHTWKVSEAELGGAGLGGTPAVISRAIAAGAAVTGPGANELALSVDEFSVVSRVKAGDELVVTAAMESSDDRHFVTSVVVRHAARGQGVVALGVVRFGPSNTQGTQPALLHHVRSGAPRLATVVSTFRAPPGHSLASELIINRLQATALVSAQGFIGRPAQFEAIRGFSVLAPWKRGDPLRLECSVIQAAGTHVTVLTQLTHEVKGQDLLCALTTFRAATTVPRLRGTS